jgi:hypothetical protein
MAFVIPPGHAHCAIEFRMTGDPQPWYCTVGVDTNGATAPQGIADHVFGAWRTTMLTLMPSVLSLTGVIAKVGQDGAAPVLGYSNQPVAFGGKSSSFTFLPQNCALLIDKLSNLGGRRNRGRIYVPGIILESDCSNVGVMTNVATYQTQIDAFDAALRAPFAPGTAGMDPVILHHDQLVNPIPPTPIAQWRVQSVISTQKKRLR